MREDVRVEKKCSQYCKYNKDNSSTFVQAGSYGYYAKSSIDFKDE